MLESRAAMGSTGGEEAAADGSGFPAVAAAALTAAALAAAALFSFSLSCTWRARWLSVNGSPGLSEDPPKQDQCGQLPVNEL